MLYKDQEAEGRIFSYGSVSLVVVIDYGLGNLRSILYKLKHLNFDAIVSSNTQAIQDASALILPGVGSFAKGMANIESSGIRASLEEAVLQNNIPILGICLGMQLFSCFSEEGHVQGLGWIKGTVAKFDNSISGAHLRVPHVGWNNIRIVSPSALTARSDASDRFYFTHSYYMECEDKSDICAVTEYGKEFPSVIARGNIMGTQFHPEKSHKYGMSMLSSFIEYSQC